MDDHACTEVFTKMTAAHQRMSELLRGMLAEYTIDEMSIMFFSDAVLLRFLRDAVRREGVELFNAAEDVVTASPIMAAYDVRYWFLRTSWGYRVDALQTNMGSPLHDNIARQAGHDPMAVVPVHASFKCPNEERYGVALATLRKSGWELLQRCDSGYGRFSYWHRPDGESDDWYLKPRLNLRDATKESP
jgi:hypothetical protein